MAITDISIPLKYVFTQATEPDDKTEGKLWYNTSDNSLYTSNGTNYVKLGIDTTFFNEIFNNSLDILDIQAQETLDGGQSAYMVRDLFTDADGFLDTVDTGNTTASFDTNLYKNFGISGADNISTTTMNNVTSITTKRGAVITVKNPILLKTATTNQPSGTAPTKWYLGKTNGGSEIASGDITTGTAIINQILTAGIYYLTADNDGSSFDTPTNSADTYPYIGTNWEITNGVTGGNVWVWNGYTADGIVTDVLIQTNKQDLNIEPSNFQVYAHKQIISGTGNITASVSFDNGANYQTVNLNTTTTITDKGDEMILKLNLNAGASNGLASCEGYGVMFW